MRRCAIWSFVVASAGACDPGDGAADLGREGQAALVPEAAFSGDTVGSIVDLALVGDRIVALDAMLDPSIHVFDVESVRHLASYGRRGDGPGEFKDPEQIVTGASDSPDDVWILDGVHQRLTRLSLGELEAGATVAPETFSMDGPNAGSLVRIPDGRVVRRRLDHGRPGRPLSP